MYCPSCFTKMVLIKVIVKTMEEIEIWVCPKCRYRVERVKIRETGVEKPWHRGWWKVAVRP